MEPQLATPRPRYNGQVLLVRPVDDAQEASKAFNYLWLALALQLSLGWSSMSVIDEPGPEL